VGNRLRLSGRFRTLWLAASISYLGDGMALVAFPLLAVQLTRSPILVAGTQVARGIPFLASVSSPACSRIGPTAAG
jgi:Transmembrane secretion effector